MPRTARAIKAGWCYHLMNRANDRAQIFDSSRDFVAFLGLMAEAQSRRSIDLLAVCLMPNHFHLVARPPADRDLSDWMHWLLTTHVRRHHGRWRSNGRIWQGRYKAFPVQQDAHLLTVMRYVERNALRAGLVDRAEDWPWGSLAWRAGRFPGLPLATSPLPLPTSWRAYVNAPQAPAEMDAIRRCASREQPFGAEAWAASAAVDLGLEPATARRGRPGGGPRAASNSRAGPIQ
jgi:putative transposase